MPAFALTAAEIAAAELAAAQAAAAQAAAAQAAAAQAAAAQAAAATNASVLSAIAPTAAPAAATTAGVGAGTGAGAGVGTGGISNLVNTTGGPTTFEQVFSQGQEIAKGSTELGKLASTAPELPALAGPDVLSPAEQARQAQLLTYTTPPEMVTPGFDVGGFETRNGIDILAKEVGVMPGVQPTISTYGAGPIGSTLPTDFNSAAPSIDKLIQPNLSSMGSNLAPTLGAQTSAFNTAPTLTQYGAGAPQGSSVLPSMPVGPPTAPGLTGLQTDLSSMGSNMPPAAPPGMPAYYGYTGNPTDLAPEVLQDATISPTVNNPFLMQSEAASAAEPNGLQGLYNEFKAMPLKDKALTGMMAASAYQMLNQPKPYEPKKYKPTFKPGLYTGYQPVQPTPYQPNYAHGGLADLGGYSDYARGGRMLKGPGDGMSDDIPATIAGKQPARLANEEFVVPADVVSHLGNGSSEAGAKVLYKMMDRVRQARTGNKKQGKQINPEKYLA